MLTVSEKFIFLTYADYSDLTGHVVSFSIDRVRTTDLILLGIATELKWLLIDKLFLNDILIYLISNEISWVSGIMNRLNI